MIIFEQNAGMTDLIGGAWLEQAYGLRLAQPLATVSQIGGRRATHSEGGYTREIFVDAMRPQPCLREHLTFHLKHETPHLELLARLFTSCDHADMVAWFREEPTGQYARRACFLFEWLTGVQLPLEGVSQGGYVDALDAAKVVTASKGREVPSKRWRVRDNMPGTPAFCPLVRRTSQCEQSMGLDVPALLADLTEEFGEELLMRSAVWMTLRESKSSFAIEGEADKEDRIQRFAGVLARRTGQGEVPLGNAALAEMQAEILGSRTTLKEFGIRQSPVFVGEMVRFQEVVHYIAPPPQDLTGMLNGLATFLERTAGQSPVMRSAVAAFGFVYIHPLADGNGRVHRFLINDILRRDNAVQDPLILPISSLITSDRGERRAYDRILEQLSRPLMQLIAGSYKFGPSVTYPDGVSSNLQLNGTAYLAQPVWRLPDLTSHVAYLADVVARTVKEDMRDESRYLRSHARARAMVKDIIEMPDAQLDRVIRSIEVNNGQLTNVLAKEIPRLTADGIWQEIVNAVRQAFADVPIKDTVAKYRERQRGGE